MNWLDERARHWRRYPVAVLGFVAGPVRLEAIGGEEWWPGWKNKILLLKGAVLNPAVRRAFAVTHLQKRSRLGFLVMWPFCFHVWFTFRFQKPGIPGSETVLYWRAGLARWDAGEGQYFCPTWYGPGLHWD